MRPTTLTRPMTITRLTRQKIELKKLWTDNGVTIPKKQHVTSKAGRPAAHS